MSTENPITDALEVSVIVNRKDKPGQVAWTEWRTTVASGCPASPGDLVMIGPDGTIDSCLLPSSSGVNTIMTAVTFYNPDAPEETTASTVVTGQTWVTAESVIVPTFYGTTSNHDPDDALVEGLTVYIENIIPSVGFTVVAYAPLGTWGEYQIMAIGT